ncbi:uncharacterized protein LOC130765554 isoform X2 [Actinidia eriantha]|uniref:uncharacterized protein LOC130765554 isoform X2 n=1 Tax=Actinidia eriantha TaxID=165200 RepID=UPI002590D90B|nr:uncharacterized protein LOC130765554 isoform X2 [Actinidia eriantha]
MTGDPRSIGGLTITNTETIRSFLISASNDPLLPRELRKTASDLSTRPAVPYKSLRSVWFDSEPSTRPGLLRLFSGSDFVFASPKPRDKSEELKARLRKLEELAERKAYDELVKDITPRKGTDEPFSSYKDQLGFGWPFGQRRASLKSLRLRALRNIITRFACFGDDVYWLFGWICCIQSIV